MLFSTNGLAISLLFSDGNHLGEMLAIKVDKIAMAMSHCQIMNSG